MKKYKLGDKWKSNFDYCGMLKTGSKSNVKNGLDKLNKLFDSYGDVNYHSESGPLWEAIKDLEKANISSAKIKLLQFRASSRATYNKLCKKRI